MQQWIEFYKRARTIYQTHSPFLFDFYTNVLTTQKEYYAFKAIENIRRECLESDRIIDFTDFGAGSKIMSGNKRSIRDIARTGISNASRCKNLFNLVNYLSPSRVLELGTSLGVSALYMASARKSTVIDTVEANSQLVELARANAEKLSLTNIRFHNKIFIDFIRSLASEDIYDLVYIDGHHTFEATTQYFNMLLPHMAENCVVVLDDIHWTEGMYDAYHALKKHERVYTSIETAYVGYLFLGQKYPKIDHTHISFWWKPWQIGLFAPNV